MNQSDMEEDLRFFMNAQSAHNLVIRALLSDNPNVATQLRGFLSEMKVENEDQRIIIEEATKLLPRR